MRIGIEAQRIFRKEKHGMDMMAVELIQNLQKLDHINDYFVFVNPDEDSAIIQPSANFHIVPLQRSPYPIWEQYFLAKAVKAYRIDILHCTSNTAPLILDIPLILTLHDIIYLEKIPWRSGSWYQRMGNLYRRWNVPLIVKKAAKILTVSKFEEKRIRNHFGLPPGKIDVLYNGIGKHFRLLDPATSEAKVRQLGLPKPYALFLGNTDPKKNLYGLIKALKNLYEQGELNINCVITDLSEEVLIPVLKELDAEAIQSRIHLTGYVANKKMPYLYNNALFFLYISIRESFGLPILEAMACGCPVITSNTSSMPEVAGDAACLVDPTDDRAISQAMKELIKNPDLRKDLVAKGLQRPASFSYSKRVEKIINIYRQVYQQAYER
ncbi:MAG TPA: glycosyltransferase family 1 protein [Cyclobacteriaceae bacterium]|nr:glycosyltransferase family 1 protein [Cyclobacteriaceae bacterium]